MSDSRISPKLPGPKKKKVVKKNTKRKNPHFNPKTSTEVEPKKVIKKQKSSPNIPRLEIDATGKYSHWFLIEKKGESYRLYEKNTIHSDYEEVFRSMPALKQGIIIYSA